MEAHLRCKVYPRSKFYEYGSWRGFELYIKVNDRYKNSKNSSLNLNRSCNLPECLDVVSTVGSSCEIGQVKLNLVPSFIESHRHSADEWLYTRCTLIVRSSESPAHALVVKDLHLEGEIFL